MKKIWIGIDPGATGAICIMVDHDDGDVMEIGFISTTDPPMDIRNNFQHFKELGFKIMVVMIEDVASLPNVSAKSNFVFGYNTAVVNVVPQTLGLMVDRIRPKAWQKEVGAVSNSKLSGPAKGKDLKKRVAAIALRLYPHAKADLYGPKGGLKDGRSDALMIAHCARIKYP